MNTQTKNDNEIMNMVKAGDLSKVGLLYERHNKNLFSYFYRMTRHRQQSEDLVQNAFIKILKYNHNFSGDGKFIYWMYSIARNMWIDEYRKKDVMKQSKELDDRDAQTLSIVNENREQELEEKKKILELALNKLTEDKREAIVLSRYQGLTYQEIAEICSSTENTIKSRIKRGMAEMRITVQQLQIL